MVNKKEKKHFKELTKEEVENTFDALTLYNLLLLPITKMKKKIEESDKIDDAVVAIYGATAIPIKRRVNALTQLSEKVNLNNGIIFSGGRSWTSIVPSSEKFEGNHEKIIKYMNNEGKSLIDERAKTILSVFPEIKDILKNRERETWTNLLKEEYSDTDESNLKSYDEMYDNYIKGKVNDIKESKERLNVFYRIFKEDKFDPEMDFSEKYKKSNEEFIKWYDAYKINNNSGQEFIDWLYNYFDNQHIENLIIHSITEVDLMNIEWKKISDPQSPQPIIEDRAATNSLENAENTVAEFLKLKKQNPDLKKLIVVSDWQYLLRQVLTTQKVAERLKEKGISDLEDIEITGYPADSHTLKHEDKNVAVKFKDIDAYNKVIKGDLTKIVLYNDVADCDITAYIDQKQIEDDGPIVLIGDKTLQEYVKQQNSDKTTNKENDERN